jgi:DNA-binding response OmpR family regulator
MPGRGLLLTVDEHLSELVYRVGREASVLIEAFETADEATKAQTQRSYDIAVVDCDDVYNGASFLHGLRRSWTTKSATIIAVLNGGTSAFDAIDAGADATIDKSKAPELLPHEILAACKALEKREHQRVAVKLPVWVTAGSLLDCRAESFNVSEGGIGLNIDHTILHDDIFTLRFELPGCEHKFHLRGEIAWADARGCFGIRFLSLPEPARGKLCDWLARRRGSANPVS